MNLLSWFIYGWLALLSPLIIVLWSATVVLRSVIAHHSAVVGHSGAAVIAHHSAAVGHSSAAVG